MTSPRPGARAASSPAGDPFLGHFAIYRGFDATRECLLTMLTARQLSRLLRAMARRHARTSHLLIRRLPPEEEAAERDRAARERLNARR